MPGEAASGKEQKKMVHDAGLEMCRENGHLKGKHYNTEKKRVEIRCNRCGRLLSLQHNQTRDISASKSKREMQMLSISKEASP